MRLAAVTTCKAAIDVTEPPGKEGGVAWEGRGGGGGWSMILCICIWMTWEGEGVEGEHDILCIRVDACEGAGAG